MRCGDEKMVKKLVEMLGLDAWSFVLLLLELDGSERSRYNG